MESKNSPPSSPTNSGVTSRKKKSEWSLWKSDGS
jgi:hypothetical protein